MKRTIKRFAITGALAASAMVTEAGAQISAQAPYQRVLLISIDGMHRHVSRGLRHLA